MKRLHRSLAVFAMVGAMACAESATEPADLETGPLFARRGAPPRPLKWIVFVSTRDGNQEIYQADRDGLNPMNLTNTPTLAEFDPSLSPDGKSVAYQVTGDLYVLDVATRSTKRLTNTADWEQHPAWSPDGKSIAFSRDPVGAAHKQVWVMDSRGNNEQRLTDFAFGADFASWSPNGKDLAIAGSPAGAPYRVYTVPSNCSLCTGGTQIGTGGIEPAWAPDGSHIVYTNNSPGGSLQPYQLIAYNMAGGFELTISYYAMHSDREPAWSRDGKVLYFTRALLGPGGWEEVHAMDYSHNMFYNDRQILSGASIYRDRSPSAGGQ